MTSGWIRILPSFLRLRFENSPTLQRIVANASWLLGDRILRLGVGMLVGVWIARYLGPAQYGVLSYAQAFVALFMPLVTLGMDNIIVRDLVKDPHRRSEIFGTVFVLRLAFALGVLTMIFLIPLLTWPNDALMRSAVMIVACGLLFQSFEVIDLWFQSQVKSKYSVIAKNAAFVSVTAVRVLLLLFQAPVLAFVMATVVEAALGGLAMAVAFRRTGQSFAAWRFSKSTATTLLRECWPFLISHLAIMVYMRIDQVMLGGLSGAEQVGIYSAALRLSEVWYFIPMGIFSSTFPVIVMSKEEGETVYLKRLQKLMTATVAMAYAIAIPMTLVSTPMVKLLFGDAYAASGPVLAVHIWSGIGTFAGVIRDSWVLTESLGKFLLVITIVGAIINISLNYALIPPWGALGAAIATLVTYLFTAFAMPWLFHRTRPIAWVMLRSLVLLR